MTTLVLDIGNSRLKWAIYGPHGWQQQGAVPNTEISALAQRDWHALPTPQQVVGCNVAGEAMRVRVEAQMARWRLSPRWITPTRAAHGVTNGYETPSQIGVDRWAGIVGAWRRYQRALLVVNAGTATTIDAVMANGRHCGGEILPGVRLMLNALASNTAALKVAPGKPVNFADNTADALASGCYDATLGAIERSFERLIAYGEKPLLVLTGGASAELTPHLSAPCELIDNLVLEGALALASVPTR